MNFRSMCIILLVAYFALSGTGISEDRISIAKYKYAELIIIHIDPSSKGVKNSSTTILFFDGSGKELGLQRIRKDFPGGKQKKKHLENL